MPISARLPALRDETEGASRFYRWGAALLGCWVAVGYFYYQIEGRWKWDIILAFLLLPLMAALPLVVVGALQTGLRTYTRFSLVIYLAPLVALELCKVLFYSGYVLLGYEPKNPTAWAMLVDTHTDYLFVMPLSAPLGANAVLGLLIEWFAPRGHYPESHPELLDDL